VPNRKESPYFSRFITLGPTSAPGSSAAEGERKEQGVGCSAEIAISSFVRIRTKNKGSSELPS